MIRFLLPLLALAAAISPTEPSWADDDNTDQRITRTIVSALQERQKAGEMQGFNIGVRVESGDVWLEGDVRQHDQRDLILDIARRVPGVRQVVNDIRVKPPETASEDQANSPRSDVHRAAGTHTSAIPVLNSRLVELAQATTASYPPYVPPNYSKNIFASKTADVIVEAIRTKNKSGKLTGFDIVVNHSYPDTAHLTGEVTDQTTRFLVLETARNQPNVRQVTDGLQLAEEGTELADRIICGTGLSPPYAKRTMLDWDDGWWMLDFMSKNTTKTGD